MKKIYLGLLSLVFAFSLHAQLTNFQLTDIDNSNATVTNNQIFTHNVAASNVHQRNFSITNISSVSQTLQVRKYEDLINTVNASDMAEAVFCAGTTCYPNTVFSAVVTLTTGETADFKADLTEASVIGESNIHYKFTNANDGNEFMNVYFKYNVPTSINQQSTFISNVSSVFPNPSNSKAFISINSTKEIATQINIINLLGTVVNSSIIELEKGKNTVALKTNNLETGIYFINLSDGNSVITRKITITK